jgi:Flp pilus assembly protein TadG
MMVRCSAIVFRRPVRRPSSGHQRPPARRGGAIAEFVIVAPILLTVLMAIIECGTLFRDYMMLHGGAREGARQAALGKTVETIRDRVRQASFSGVSDGYITIEYYDSTTSAWLPVINSVDGVSNAAPAGSLVRVKITSYPHGMVTGRFFGWMAGYSNGTMPMSAKLIMRRE